jgi:hypothetical protein
MALSREQGESAFQTVCPHKSALNLNAFDVVEPANLTRFPKVDAHLASSIDYISKSG